MENWKKIQSDLLKKAIKKEGLDIIKSDQMFGQIHGTIYYSKSQVTNKGVLLVHGIVGKRHDLEILAERLCMCGYFCYSIDLPSHFASEQRLSIGQISENVTEAISIMKTRFRLNNIAVIAHSLGAVGTLFSIGGYNTKIENAITYYNNMLNSLSLQKQQAIIDKNSVKIEQISKKMSDVIDAIEMLTLESINITMKKRGDAKCYVFLAMPPSLKKAAPGFSILGKIRQSFLKRIFHMVNDRETSKELGLQNKNSAELIYLHVKNVEEFINYISNSLEPVDYIKLIEILGNIKNKNSNFFEKFNRDIIKAKPKLLIYGSFDLVLRPFLNKKNIDSFYSSLGNIDIEYGNYSHIMNENPLDTLNSVVFKNTKVTERIVDFLNKNL